MRIKRRVIEQLTDDELTFLKEFTKGYGRTQYACTISKIPMGSMRKILDKGRGIMPNVNKLRSTILKDMDGANVQHIMNNQKIAS